MKDSLRGAIVLTQPEAAFIKADRLQPTTSETPVRIGQPPNPGVRLSQTDARQQADLLRDAGAGVILRTSAGGVPRFNPVQDYVDYDVRTHHTNMDTPERVRVDDLKQNTIVLAWFIYQAASMDQPLARVSTE